MSFVEIPVGVVSDRADFTENPPLMDFLRQGLKRKLRMSGLSCAHSILIQAFRTHIHVTGSWGGKLIFY